MKPLQLSSLLFLLSVSIFFSCSKDDKPQALDIDKIELNFPAGKSSQVFNITTSGAWRIEAIGLSPYLGPNKGETDWYTVTPIGDTGNAIVTVTAKEGTAGNSATLRIKYGGKEKTVELKQVAATESE